MPKIAPEYVDGEACKLFYYSLIGNVILLGGGDELKELLGYCREHV